MAENDDENSNTEQRLADAANRAAGTQPMDAPIINATITELVAVLKPFATAATLLRESEEDGNLAPPLLRCGDLRAAAAAYAKYGREG